MSRAPKRGKRYFLPGDEGRADGEGRKARRRSQWRDPKRRDLAPFEGDGYPSPFVWVDAPTVRLDDAGRAAAARHIREGRERPVREFEAS